MSNNEIAIINEESIKDKIYIIRGEKVMLDFELAEIYGYSTKAFNQQVKNNIDKFKGYTFQLTMEEYRFILMSKNLTSSWGGTRKLSYAFTEQGIYMLMTVLRGPLATEQSRKLINIFKGMKDYLESTKQLTTVNDIISLTSKVYSHEKRIETMEGDIEKMKDNFIDESMYKEFLIMDGHKFEAIKAYKTIFSMAKKSIIIVDNYISYKTLDLLRGINTSINVTIYSTNKSRDKVTSDMLQSFINETHINVSITPTSKEHHDRFIIIDNEEVYFSGPSLKDAGKSITTITSLTHPEVKSILIKILNSKRI